METVGGTVFPEELIREYIYQQTVDVEGDTGQGGTENTMVTAITGYHQDLCMVTGYNSSDQTINISLRDVAGGTVRLMLPFLAGEVKVWQFSPPFKQTTAGDAWTAMRPNDGAGTVTMYAQVVKKIK